METRDAPGRAVTPRDALGRRMLGMLDRRLGYLFEAGRAGSIRSAAQFLRLNPSALSRQIAHLEEEIGAALMERHGRGICLTAIGTLLTEYYLQQRETLDHVAGRISDIKGLRSGEVIISTGEGFTESLIRDAMVSFVGENDAIRFEIYIGSVEEILSDVRGDRSHFGLLYNLPADPAVISHAAKHHAVSALVKPGHPLAALGRPVTIAEVGRYEVVMTPSTSGVRQALIAAELQARMQLAPRLVCNSIASMLKFVEHMDGVAFGVAYSVQREIDEGRIVAVELDGMFSEGVSAHLITRRGRRLPAPAAAFMRLLLGRLAMLRDDRRRTG